MNSTSFFQGIQLQENSAMPKYLQVANSIVDSIKMGKIQPTQLLPSINELNFNLEISRWTAEKCYRHLRMTGVLHSVPGKGFYTRELKTKESLRIFLLFNKLTEQKGIMYDAFISAMGNNADVDIHIYDNNFLLFEKLLKNRKEYDYYIIVPHSQNGEEPAYELINQIPKNRLIILGKKTQRISGIYSSIVENYEQEIYAALIQVSEKLQKYHTLKIILPKDDHLPQEIIQGFRRFCICKKLNCSVVGDIVQEEISEGEVYIDFQEDDLSVLIEKIAKTDLIIGRQVGLISYNDTPLKRILSNGITTISADFKQMGILIAQMIKDRSCHHLEVPISLKLRSSL